ncbi:coiled-coil domain-containing protein [Cohnella abietis]|uniref:Uncharacterized protein n=1 Tax=Cohnella abietis TaxID=2507935 RepID=A0A3T1CZY1_9BACL|nr:hypothetical protein [Cohnella abietis]BBI31403.1 hypothetical protein KCTCHS21_08020 [Cohnella abietis]
MLQRKTASFLWRLALLCLIMVTMSPPLVSAAKPELTAPIKEAFDKTAASADKTTAAKLNGLYNELSNLLKQDQENETKIKAIHYRNEEALLALRKQIRDINADKLTKLEAQVKQTKNRYKPLFETYSSVNKQITVAKKLKNKTLTTMLSTQADVLKLSVKLAREDIKNKEEAYKTAKGATSLTIKSARDKLDTIDPLKVQIKAHRGAISLPRTSLSPVWTNFKHATKKSDIPSTLDSLSTLVMLSRQIVEQQQKIYILEGKITDIIVKTKAQFL